VCVCVCARARLRVCVMQQVKSLFQGAYEQCTCGSGADVGDDVCGR
jgi:hypothetical protein